jgi:hypothetical protein
MVGICREGRRPVAAQATLEHRRRFGFSQMAAIQEQVIRILRNFAPGRQSCDGHTLQGDEAKRVLGPMGKESMAVPNRD